MELTKAELVWVKEWAETVAAEFNNCPDPLNILGKIELELGCGECRENNYSYFCKETCRNLK